MIWRYFVFLFLAFSWHAQAEEIVLEVVRNGDGHDVFQVVVEDDSAIPLSESWRRRLRSKDDGQGFRLMDGNGLLAYYAHLPSENEGQPRRLIVSPTVRISTEPLVGDPDGRAVLRLERAKDLMLGTIPDARAKDLRLALWEGHGVEDAVLYYPIRSADGLSKMIPVRLVLNGKEVSFEKGEGGIHIIGTTQGDTDPVGTAVLSSKNHELGREDYEITFMDNLGDAELVAIQSFALPSQLSPTTEVPEFYPFVRVILDPRRATGEEPELSIERPLASEIFLARYANGSAELVRSEKGEYAPISEVSVATLLTGLTGNRRYERFDQVQVFEDGLSVRDGRTGEAVWLTRSGEVVDEISGARPGQVHSLIWEDEVAIALPSDNRLQVDPELLLRFMDKRHSDWVEIVGDFGRRPIFAARLPGRGWSCCWTFSGSELFSVGLEHSGDLALHLDPGNGFLDLFHRGSSGEAMDQTPVAWLQDFGGEKLLGGIFFKLIRPRQSVRISPYLDLEDEVEVTAVFDTRGIETKRSSFRVQTGDRLEGLSGLNVDSEGTPIPRNHAFNGLREYWKKQRLSPETLNQLVNAVWATTLELAPIGDWGPGRNPRVVIYSFFNKKKAEFDHAIEFARSSEGDARERHRYAQMALVTLLEMMAFATHDAVIIERARKDKPLSKILRWSFRGVVLLTLLGLGAELAPGVSLPLLGSEVSIADHTPWGWESVLGAGGFGGFATFALSWFQTPSRYPLFDALDLEARLDSLESILSDGKGILGREKLIEALDDLAKGVVCDYLLRRGADPTPAVVISD